MTVQTSSNSANDTSNKVMIITGASRGIGAATARLAAQHGYDICVNYLSNRAAADDVVESVRAMGRRVIAVQADMGAEADIVRLFATVDAELGRATALVCNAANIGHGRRRVESMNAADINTLLAANVTGTLICAREAIRRMSTRHGGGGGAIVNVSSIAARMGSPLLWIDYAASKGAIDTLTIGLSQEVAKEGIRVNAVRPGLIDTEIHAAGGMPDRAVTGATHVPMKRAGTAAEVAETIVWLASPAASYVSGAIIDVTGALR